jgi:hypothetical protein
VGRSIGLDVHRDFCQVAIVDGGRARSAGRVPTTVERLELFGQSLAADDRVVLEATGNALAIARILEPHVAEVSRTGFRGGSEAGMICPGGRRVCPDVAFLQVPG